MASMMIMVSIRCGRLTRTDIVHYMISATKELSELLGIPLEEVGIHE